jgi:hypothetical protein
MPATASVFTCINARSQPLSHSESLDTAFTLISAKARPSGRAFSLSSLESNMGLTSPLLSNMERHLLYRGRGGHRVIANPASFTRKVASLNVHTCRLYSLL